MAKINSLSDLQTAFKSCDLKRDIIHPKIFLGKCLSIKSKILVKVRLMSLEDIPHSLRVDRQLLIQTILNLLT